MMPVPGCLPVATGAIARMGRFRNEDLFGAVRDGHNGHAIPACRQGEDRIEPPETSFPAATTAASDLGVKRALELAGVPGTGHGGEAKSRAGAEAIFGTK